MKDHKRRISKLEQAKDCWVRVRKDSQGKITKLIIEIED